VYVAGCRVNIFGVKYSGFYCGFRGAGAGFRVHFRSQS
jgi:hypothetical protein